MQTAKKITTNSAKETRKLGEKLAKDVLALRRFAPQDKNNHAVVFALRGDLGGGKTTFLQGFAKMLGIKEKITSPTFVIMKKFKIKGKRAFAHFYHFDCYRIKNTREILELDFKEIISNPQNIIAVEWPENLGGFLPKGSVILNFKFAGKNKREIFLPAILKAAAK